MATLRELREGVQKRKKFRQDMSARFSCRRDAHEQRCPGCNDVLIATEDKNVNGTHHWILVCGRCVLRFEYSRGQLWTYPLEGRSQRVEW